MVVGRIGALVSTKQKAVNGDEDFSKLIFAMRCFYFGYAAYDLPKI